MRKIFLILLLCVVDLFPLPVFGQSRRASRSEPDSQYVEKESETRDEGGGILDFLPFFGNRSKKVQTEKLAPSPPPRESKPVLSKDELEELQMVADHWLLTSEITEPEVRQDGNGNYYRDYVVFSGEYKIDVLRGNSKEAPFVAYVYVQGDYFKTKLHDEEEEAKLDFNFTYEPLDFRIIFERVEEWEYSEDPEEAPFRFKEEWEFRKLQSKAKLDIPEGAPTAAATDEDEPPQSTNP